MATTVKLSTLGGQILAAITGAAFKAKGDAAGLATDEALASGLAAKQDADATLAALAGLAHAAGAQVPVFTAADVAALLSVGQAAGNLLNREAGDALYPAKAAVLLKAGNLSDVANAATARGNLGLGGAATLNVGTGTGTVAAGDDGRITGAMLRSGGEFTGEATLAVTLAHTSDRAVGFRGLPQNTQNAAYTFSAIDSGRSVFHDEVTARAWTIPAHGSVPFPLGSAITLVNNHGSGAITITQGTGVTLRQSGSTSTGNRTLSANGVATLLKTKANEWYLCGNGLS